MMPPSDRCRSAIPASLCKSKAGATRDRFDLIWTRRRRILITQTTIKPSRFVTFLIYFARLSMSCCLPTAAELSLITCLNDRRYLFLGEGNEDRKYREMTKIVAFLNGNSLIWVSWWSHSGADAAMLANILQISCSAVVNDWLLLSWLLGLPASVLLRIWISLM